jgi:hypothetical protein
LPDDFCVDLKRYKYRGSSGKVNLALDGLPNFKAMPGEGATPARRDLNFTQRRLHGKSI